MKSEIEDIIYAHGIGPLASTQIADDIIKNVMSKYLIITPRQADELIELAESLYEGGASSYQ
jgi:hypothetical protein